MHQPKTTDPASSVRATGDPPRPHLVLRVAVSGHRPGERLPDAKAARVARQVRQALHCAAVAAATVHTDPAYAWAFDPAPPRLRLVSALAEGADRIAADVAFAAGWELEAALPMPRAAYAEDFATPDSRADLERLLGAARAVFELPAPPPDAPRTAAYGAVGHLLLDHCDLLLAVWDGGRSGGHGGTRAVVDEAVRRGIPVVWVHTLDAALPALWDGRRATPLGGLEAAAEPSCGADTALGRVVAALLAPPADPPPDTQADADSPGPRTSRAVLPQWAGAR